MPSVGESTAHVAAPGNVLSNAKKLQSVAAGDRRRVARRDDDAARARASVATMMNQRPARRSYFTFGPNVVRARAHRREERVGRQVQHAVGRAGRLRKAADASVGGEDELRRTRRAARIGRERSRLAERRAGESLQERRRLGRVERGECPAASALHGSRRTTSKRRPRHDAATLDDARRRRQPSRPRWPAARSSRLISCPLVA